jgi:hypothetical protein
MIPTINIIEISSFFRLEFATKQPKQFPMELHNFQCQNMKPYWYVMRFYFLWQLPAVWGSSETWVCRVILHIINILV